MYRKLLSSFSAVAMAAVLISTQAVTAFATEGATTTTVTDSGTVAAVEVSGNNKVGVDAASDDDIHVTGDVIVDGDNSVGVNATDNSQVLVDGNVAATGENSRLSFAGLR